MASRGPDGAGLAHRRLAFVDLPETASQPMSNADDYLRIVFNGKIHNYEALRKALEATGVRFRSTSDSEVLLNLYTKEGEDMTRYFGGMYAFTIWDETKRGLCAARDPFGTKPLCYADDGSAIKIASQVKALLRGGAVDTAREPAGPVAFFLWGYVPEPYTSCKGIKSLPAGSTLWIDEADRKQIKSFFELPEIAKPAMEPTAEVSPDLASVLFDSAQHHLVADVP